MNISRRYKKKMMILKKNLTDDKHEENVQPSDNTVDTLADSDEIKFSEKYGDKLDSDGEASFDATQISQTDEPDNTNESAESAVKIEGKNITADTKPFAETHVTLNGLAGEIKGTLNAREITQGVMRVSIKNDEMWVYYNDDINLNNVMSPVIELLNAANYHYLIFNRLARTDNAIVFTINGNDSLNTMETINNET